MTDTESNKNREARGQGIANVVTGFFGGMAGCAMIAQSVINVNSGGKGRLSTLIASLFFMFLIIVLGGVVVLIPMAVLVGIMIMVSIGTFDWNSYSYLKNAPKTDAIVMLVTVAIVVATHDLSIGVIAGVILSAIFFVAKISKIKLTKQETMQNITFFVEGQLFFASVEGFLDGFDVSVQHKNIIINFSNAHIWDDSAVGAIDKVVIKYRENNNNVSIKNLNAASKKILDKLAVFNNPNGKLSAH